MQNWAIAYIAAACFVCVSNFAAAQPGDSSYLYGIHWYHSDTNNNDVEAMTGSRGVWVVDQALLDSTATIAAPNPWETPWVTSPTVDKTQPWAKVSYTSAIAAKGHTNIIRLHPFWGVNIPYPGDPYTVQNFADDCKAAANLMRYVRTWQIGNEANLNGENTRWNESSQRYDLPWPDSNLAQTPEMYAATYLACRDRIHEITPDTTPATQIVLMQPCSPGNAEAGIRFMSSDDFLTRMIAAIPDKSKIDGFALHGYAQPGGSNFGADGFISDIRRQLAIIDQAGLGDRPIYITEFNKHMPNATEASIGAKFVTTAYEALHQWNSDTPQLWPAQPNHQVKAATWFIYREDPGWSDYSLLHWKTEAPSTLSSENPWYGFQLAATHSYPAGSGSGPALTSTDEWWAETFSDTALDTDWPLPLWDTAGLASSVTVAAGEARIAPDSSFQLAGLGISQVPFGNFALEANLAFPDPEPIATGEANFDIRIRQAGSGGPGYSFSLYSTPSAVRPGQAWLRKTAFWDTHYKNGSISGGLSAGDEFLVQLISRNDTLQVRLLRLPALTPVLDWTGPSAVESIEFVTGGIGFYTYNMKDARLRSVRMGGEDMPLTPSKIGEWALYE